ncbi:MAG: RNA methyltransferase [Verrucomicrobia bacterium]|nr:RNA methyltransferase [Verrucomicrobiota bacterium]
MKILSTKNEQIKHLVHLKDKRDRDRHQEYIIEGYRELFHAKNANIPLKKIFYCPELFLGQNEMDLIHSFQNCEKIECADEPFMKMSYRDRPDGLIAIASQMHRKREELEKILDSKAPFIVVVESIEKPGNLGSILRSCDATAVDALIVCDPKTDIHNPNVIRSSVGAFFLVPIFEMESHEAIRLLKEHHIAVLATTPHTDKFYDDVDLRQGVAIVLGTEQLGLSDLWMGEANLKVKMPMLGTIDSLNVSNAASIMMYEVVRQRRHASRL